MSRITVVSFVFLAFVLSGASMIAGCVRKLPAQEQTSVSELNLMIVNQNPDASWLEVGWSSTGDREFISGQKKIGWVTSGMTSFRAKEISNESVYYLLLYDAPGGSLLSVSRPIPRTDSDLLFVDATLDRDSMTIDSY